MPGKLQKRIHRKDSVAGFGSIVVRRKPPMRLEKRHTERRDIWLGWVYVRVGPAWVYRRRRWRYRSKRRFACVYSFVRVRSSESSVQNGDGQRRHIRIRNQFVDRSSFGLSSIDILELQVLYYKVLYVNMTPLRTALQNEVAANVEYGEAIFSMLKAKAERQLEVIAPAHPENVVEFWRALLDMQTVQAKPCTERYRLSVLQV